MKKALEVYLGLPWEGEAEEKSMKRVKLTAFDELPDLSVTQGWL